MPPHIKLTASGSAPLSPLVSEPVPAFAVSEPDPVLVSDQLTPFFQPLAKREESGFKSMPRSAQALSRTYRSGGSR